MQFVIPPDLLGGQQLLLLDGVVRLAGSALPQAGQRVQFALSTGDRVEGSVIHSVPPAEFACTAENLNHGLFRAGYENCGDQAGALRKRLEDALARTFA